MCIRVGDTVLLILTRTYANCSIYSVVPDVAKGRDRTDSDE